MEYVERHIVENSFVPLLSDPGVSKVEVRFIKVDGTVRVMTCTKRADLIPSSEPGEKKLRQLSDDVVRVFDLDKQAWRSFRKDYVVGWIAYIE